MKTTKQVKTTLTVEVDSVVPSNWDPTWAYNHFRNAMDAGLNLPTFKREAQHTAFIHGALSREIKMALTNQDRADRAAQALAPFIDQSNGDEAHQVAVVDLLANILHWCDRKNVSFDNALASATNHWSAEVLEESSVPKDKP